MTGATIASQILSIGIFVKTMQARVPTREIFSLSLYYLAPLCELEVDMVRPV